MPASHSLALSGPITPQQARQLEATLLSITGVLSADVSPSHGRVSLNVDDTLIDPLQLQAALQRLQQDAPDGGHSHGHGEGGCCGGCGG